MRIMVKCVKKVGKFICQVVYCFFFAMIIFVSFGEEQDLSALKEGLEEINKL